jgi:hypothetical protein
MWVIELLCVGTGARGSGVTRETYSLVSRGKQNKTVLFFLLEFFFRRNVFKIV